MRLISLQTISAAVVPVDDFVVGFTPVFTVALSLGIEIHAFQGGQYSLGRVDHGPPGQGVWRQCCFTRWCKGPPAGIYLPGRGITIIEFNRCNANDTPVAYIDPYRSAGGSVDESFDTAHPSCTNYCHSRKRKCLLAHVCLPLSLLLRHRPQT